MKKIILAGGSGNLGELLIQTFTEKNIHCVVLSRQEKSSTNPSVSYVYWDGENLDDWVAKLEDADVLINLSGKSIQCRFTEKNKKILESSRVVPTKLLGRALKTLHNPPRLWINLSGVSIFGGKAGLHNETSQAYGDDFLARLTKTWEQSFTSSDTAAQTHKVILRVSPVLMNSSGLFATLKPLVKWGLGGQVANGKQYLAWIHKQDFTDLILWIINQEKPAPIYHACSPQPVSNAEFMRAFRQNYKQPIGLPLPTFMAKVGSFVIGVDSGLLLQTISVTAKAALDEGFTYSYPNIHDALKALSK